MTPKEKAKELIQKTAISTLWGTNYTGGDDIPIYKNQYAKQCALIAVNETIRTLNEDIRDLDVRGNVLLDLIDYWREVKQEIEKI